MSTRTTRFAIRFDAWYGWMSRLVLIPPAASWVEVGEREIVVRMAWAFSTRFDRADVVAVEPSTQRPISRGVHGLSGRWLVNGSAEGLVVIRLHRAVPARMMGLPISLRELIVSVEDSAGFIAALAG